LNEESNASKEAKQVAVPEETLAQQDKQLDRLLHFTVDTLSCTDHK